MAYPKKEGYAKAEIAFAKALADGVSVGTIVAGAKHYATAKASVDSKWLMMPARWLSERCWRESPQAPRPASVVARKKKEASKSPLPARPELRVAGEIDAPFEVGQNVRHKETGASGQIVDTVSVRGDIRVRWDLEGDHEWVKRSVLSREAQPKAVPLTRDGKEIHVGMRVVNAHNEVGEVRGILGNGHIKVDWLDAGDDSEGPPKDLWAERLRIPVGTEVWKNRLWHGKVSGWVSEDRVLVWWDQDYYGDPKPELCSELLLEAPLPKLPWSMPVIEAPPLPSYIRPDALVYLNDGTSARVCIDKPFTDDGMVMVEAADEWGSCQRRPVNPEEILGPAGDDRRPALGPDGDSLDDFE
jgi:hypothetical protein